MRTNSQASIYDNILSGELTPFSFNIGNKPARVQKLRDRVSRDDEQVEERVIIYDVDTYPLTVSMRMRVEKANSVMTLQLTFRATQSIHQLIEAVHIFDLSLTAEPEGTHSLRIIKGGDIMANPEGERGQVRNSRTLTDKAPPRGLYPPREFDIVDNDLSDPVELEEVLEGRSSRTWLPIWFLHTAEKGIWFGPEWSGSWKMRAAHEAEGTRAYVCLPRLRFVMHQAEELEMPAVSIGTYEGDVWEGCLHLRKAIKDIFTPRIKGEIPDPFAVYQLLGGNIPHFDAKGKEEDRELMARLGLEYLVFASSWYRDVHTDTHFPELRDKLCKYNPKESDNPNWLGWWETCGHFIPSEERFPEGLAKYTESLKAEGIEFGLWYDPRVSIFIDEYTRAEDVLVPFRAYNSNDKQYRLGLINLGCADGRRYMLDLMEKFVTEYGAGWLWHDLNVEVVERYWRSVEESERQGVMELKHLMGMQQVYHDFQERHPEVVIEWCGSGGTMIDLGSLRFSHTFWVSDYTDPNPKTDFSCDIGITYRSRLNWIFPASLILNDVAPRLPEDEHGRHIRLEHLIAQCGSSFCLNQALHNTNAADQELIGDMVKVFKQVRPLLNKEFYGLFKPKNGPLPQTSWDGWEFYDPAKDEGVLMLFRLSKSEKTSEVIQPKYFTSEHSTELLAGEGRIECTGQSHKVHMSSKAAIIKYSKK